MGTSNPTHSDRDKRGYDNFTPASRMATESASRTTATTASAAMTTTKLFPHISFVVTWERLCCPVYSVT